MCVCLSVRVRLCVCSNKGCQEHLQKVYTAMAGAMISAAVGAVAYFFVPLGVSGLESACGGGGVRGWVGVGEVAFDGITCAARVMQWVVKFPSHVTCHPFNVHRLCAV